MELRTGMEAPPFRIYLAEIRFILEINQKIKLTLVWF